MPHRKGAYETCCFWMDCWSGSGESAGICAGNAGSALGTSFAGDVGGERGDECYCHAVSVGAC